MNINRNIAFTYITSNKKLTGVAAFGVLLGMAVYIFMNSLLAGFDKTSNDSIFKTTPHIRIYKDDEISKPLIQSTEKIPVIINPKIVPKSNKIENPNQIIKLLQQQKEVYIVTPQVMVNVFYNNGKSQLSGASLGLNPEEGNQMFNIQSFMVEGNFVALKTNSNGIVIGSGIAEKMNVKTGDNISITSQRGINKIMKIVGIFKTNNSKEDKSRSYITLASAQQLLRENRAYITDIDVNLYHPQDVEKVATQLTQLTGYQAEDWKKANESYMAASRMRAIVITFVSTTILLVAGFGIYNILNMTISQKLNDIAILKAMGFKGKDVIHIFVTQAMTIGMIGTIFGVMVASILVQLLKKVWIGGDIGYFPIDYELKKFIQGIVFGLVITFFAGFIPAKKAAKVDPVSIFRK